jgi:hypothetical protein
VVALHTMLVQSEGPKQPCPVAQGVQVGPPQSTSVSMPSFLPSWQVGNSQVKTPNPPSGAMQTAGDAQSALTLHTFPTLHGMQTGPPQPMSVSVPFLTGDMQLVVAASLASVRASTGGGVSMGESIGGTESMPMLVSFAPSWGFRASCVLVSSDPSVSEPLS